MAWTAPYTFTSGEIVTAAILNTHVRDNTRYLKGLDGVPTVESGLIIDNTGGDEYIKFPLLSTAECTSVLNAEGEVAFDEQTHTPKYYNGSAIKDIGDHGSLGGLTDDDHTQYQKESLLTTQGDIPYATGASAWARLAKGTALQYLRMNAGATAPEWTSFTATKELWSSVGAPNTTIGDFISHNVYNGTIAYISFKVPHDFTTITSAEIILVATTSNATANYDVASDYGAIGEAYNTHSEADAATTYNVTLNQLYALDISGILTAIAADDYVGISLTNNIVAEACYVIGLRLKYA